MVRHGTLYECDSGYASLDEKFEPFEMCAELLILLSQRVDLVAVLLLEFLHGVDHHRLKAAGCEHKGTVGRAIDPFRDDALHLLFHEPGLYPLHIQGVVGIGVFIVHRAQGEQRVE